MVIPRRMLGFGFALFLMLVALALIYAQFAMERQGNPADSGMTKRSMSASQTVAKPLPVTVTPDSATTDLIDEAMADRDDFSTLTADEIADTEEGN